MATSSLNYQALARRFIILPFLLILFTCSCLYIYTSLSDTIKYEVAITQHTGQLLAKTAAIKNTTLISDQVEATLAHSPQIESIMFFPTNTPKATTSIMSFKNIFLEKYQGISEPVFIEQSATPTDNTAVKQLIGYINITLNLQTVRYTWLKNNLPAFSLIIVLSIAMLAFILATVKKSIKRLPYLESLSHRILQDESISLTNEDLAPKSNEGIWVFEHALWHLISKQKMSLHQIEQLNTEKQLVREEELRQISHHSSFQNTLTHEFKISLNRIEAGLQLLKNQYISNEQKDAFDIISTGTADLNSKLNQIIQINRIEKGQANIEKAQFSPSRLISDVIEKFQVMANDKNLLLIAKVYHADYVLEGDVQKIRLVLSSLVENAIRFTDKGSVTIISQLQHLEKTIRWALEVQDTGIGIAENYQQQVFEPFFQINPEIKHSVNKDTVGLFLVKKLTELINGQITLTSRVDEGTSINLSLILDDWKTNYDRNLLKDKSFAVWYEDDTILQNAQRLKQAGGTFKGFNDPDLLLDYLLKHNTDMLLISYLVSQEKVLKLVKNLRLQEEQHRILIVRYYQPSQLSDIDVENLKSVGVDYAEAIAESEISFDLNEYLKHILQYLV
ncbi:MULTISPECIES: sensor histidine kinase [unclassified Moraxella]|uniref:sensor histidine kinase n=1 Tax=unclassified Moraxella TaxID=2685852 RepID=UPI003AF98B19